MNDRAYVRHIRQLHTLGGFGGDSLAADTVDRLLRICEKRQPATPPPALKPCGTYAAYMRHLRHGETPDAECRAAATAYKRQFRSGAIR